MEDSEGLPSYEELINDICKCLSPEEQKKVDTDVNGKPLDWDGTFFRSFFELSWSAHKNILIEKLDRYGLLGALHKQPKRKIDDIPSKGIDPSKARIIFDIIGEVEGASNEDTLERLIDYYGSSFRPKAFTLGNNQKLVNKIRLKLLEQDLTDEELSHETRDFSSVQYPSDKPESAEPLIPTSTSSSNFGLNLYSTNTKKLALTFLIFTALAVVSILSLVGLRQSAVQQATLLYERADEHIFKDKNRLGIILALEAIDILDGAFASESEIGSKLVSLLQSTAGNFVEARRIELPTDTTDAGISNDGQRYFTVNHISENTVRISVNTLESGEEVFSLELDKSSYQEIKLDELLDRLWVKNSAGSAAIWDINTGEKKAVFLETPKIKELLVTDDLKHAFTLSHLGAANAWGYDENSSTFHRTQGIGTYSNLKIESQSPLVISAQVTGSNSRQFLYLKDGVLEKLLPFDIPIYQEHAVEYFFSDDYKYIAIYRDNKIELGLREKYTSGDMKLDPLFHKNDKDEEEPFRFINTLSIPLFDPSMGLIVQAHESTHIFDVDGYWVRKAGFIVDTNLPARTYLEATEENDRDLSLNYKDLPSLNTWKKFLIKSSKGEAIRGAKISSWEEGFYITTEDELKIISRIQPRAPTTVLETKITDSRLHSNLFFTADSSLVAYGDYPAAKMWDVNSGKLVQELHSPYSGSITNISFNGDHSKALVTYVDSISIFDLASGREIFSKNLYFKEMTLAESHFSEDESHIAFRASSLYGRGETYEQKINYSDGFSLDGTRKSISLDNRENYESFMSKYPNFSIGQDTVTTGLFPLFMALENNSGEVVSKDGKLQAYISEVGIIINRFDQRDPTLVENIDSGSYFGGIRFSPTGRHLVAISSNSENSEHSIVVYNTESESAEKTIRYDQLNRESIQFNREGTLLAIHVIPENKLNVLDLESGKVIFDRQFANGIDLNGFQISPDSSKIAWKQSDGNAFIAPLNWKSRGDTEELISYFQNLKIPDLTVDESQRFGLN